MLTWDSGSACLFVLYEVYTNPCMYNHWYKLKCVCNHACADSSSVFVQINLSMWDKVTLNPELHAYKGMAAFWQGAISPLDIMGIFFHSCGLPWGWISGFPCWAEKEIISCLCVWCESMNHGVCFYSIALFHISEAALPLQANWLIWNTLRRRQLTNRASCIKCRGIQPTVDLH